MKFSQLSYAQLDQEEMALLHELEGKIGSIVVAVKPAAKLANVNEEQLNKIKSLEEELGIVLLAYAVD